MRVKNDHHRKFSNLSNWKEEAWKKSGLQRDSNPWPPRCPCIALPTELWSHTLGARSIYWVHISHEERYERITFSLWAWTWLKSKFKIQDITSEEFHLNGHNEPSYKTPSHPYPYSHNNQSSSNNRCNEANMKTHVSSHNMPPKLQDLGVT